VREYTLSAREFRLAVTQLGREGKGTSRDFAWERHSPEWRGSKNANREIGVPGLLVAKLGGPAYAMIRREIHGGL